TRRKLTCAVQSGFENRAFISQGNAMSDLNIMGNAAFDSRLMAQRHLQWMSNDEMLV
ncbi:conserved hypothetical protein, partial [Ricinus communis]